MKDRRGGKDIEATIAAVEADHLPGSSARPQAIPPRPGRALPDVSVAPKDRKRPSPPGKRGASREAAPAPHPDAGPDEGIAEGREEPERRKVAREERQAAKLRSENAGLKSELGRFRGERDALKSELQRANRLREALERTLEAEKGRHEAAARDLFAEWRRAVGLEFEGESRRSAVAKARERNADAFALASRALDAQAAANARYGTVRALREEFHRIDRLADELRHAAGDSLLPVPEIGHALHALETRRADLLADPATAALLAPPDPGTVRLSLLAVEELRDGKESLPRIERIQETVAFLRDAGLLDAAGEERVRRALGGKAGRIVRAEAARAMGRRSREPETFESLVREGKASRYALLVDGNNVLITNEGFLGEGGAVPDFRGKRERLNAALAALSGSFRTVHAVYDGFEERTEAAGERFAAVYTDKGRRSADDWIAARVAEEKPDSCIVATDDAELADRCPAVHAVVGARHLYDFLVQRGLMRR